MKLFVALSFLVLAVLYWAASGGAGFEPEARPEPEVLAEAEPLAPQDGVDGPDAASAPASPPAATAVAPTAPPEGLPASPLDPDAALAALAPDLAGTAAPEPTPVPAGPLREVTGDRVNVRAGPGTGFDVVGQIARGERAEVLGLQGGWASVRAGAVEGWMSERFLAAP